MPGVQLQLEKTTVKSADDELTPQPHGGALRSSGQRGNKGGTGRPHKAIRARCAAAFDERIGIAVQIADDSTARAQDRIAALALLAKLAGLNDPMFDPQLLEEHREAERQYRKRSQEESDPMAHLLRQLHGAPA